MTTKRILIEKLKNGGQITLEDIESLGSKKKSPDSRPAKVCSPKHALAKAMKGLELNKWELEELAKSPNHAFGYAKFIGKRFPECEEHLLNSNSRQSDIAEYFLDIVKEPHKEFEDWLKRHPEYVRRYCVEILKSRWKEGEEAVLKIKHRWGHELDMDEALAYQKELVGGTWDDLEKIILNGKVKVSDRADAAKAYFKNCGVGRHEATERRLLKFGNTAAIFLYAKFCVGGRLPDELHNRMILSGKKGAKKYLAWLSVKKKTTLAYLKSLGEEERKELFPETSGRTG